MLIVACQSQSEKNAHINITAFNAYTQYAAFDYLYICDSLTRQHQNEKPVDTKNALFIDGSSINVERHSNIYRDTKENPLLSKISFNVAYDAFHRPHLTESVFIGNVLAVDTQEVKDLLQIKFASKKAPPIFMYHQTSYDSSYYDLIALVNNTPALKISNKDIDKIEIQRVHSITEQLAVLTGERSEEIGFTISFKLNNSFIKQIEAIKSDSTLKLFIVVDFYNKTYAAELDIDELKKSQEIKLPNIFNKKEIEEIKEQYSGLIKTKDSML
jgi:hypothetical protein